VCASGLVVPEMKQRILSLTLNDNGPQLADAAITRIRSYAGSPPAFNSVLELEAFSGRCTNRTAGSATRSGVA
jgi:hypothetical protein